MVDTIVLRVHNLRKYRNLRNYISRIGSGSTIRSVNIPSSEIEEFRRNEIDDDTLAIKYIVGLKKHESFLISSSKKILNSSGHYYLNIREIEKDDCIEFNFSIPKYFYGTNILLFVEHHWDKDYKYYQNKEIKYNLVKSYDLIIKFINSFFAKEFPLHKIDNRDVEINRIDLCYNQVFPSEADALRFLEYQKKIRRKHSRKDNDRRMEYDTSIMFTTKRK